ncbi:ATP-dependent RNA helicase DDX24 isoform X2 [Narcine bancroftii]|uniref:ATP-dependent RNA helicase DDX24 isoform X2 n=1 Tax=Narcine bancroftii TaxID=1343680 RepID=UPI00383153DA
MKERRKKLPKAHVRKIKETGQWKPFAIDASCFGEDDLEGLVCCEELSDYELIDATKSTKKVKKRTSDNSEEIKSLPKKQKVSRFDLPTSTKKTKIKRKKKKFNSQAAEVEEDSINLSEDINELKCSDKNDTKGVKTNNTIVPRKKKKKTRGSRSVRLDEKVKNWTKYSCSSEQMTDVSAWKDLFVPEPVLQALSSLGYSSPTPIQALVLPPAIRDKLDILGAAETGIKTAAIVGGMATQKQERILNCRPEIVIATPGRLWELIKERHPHLCHLKQLRCLVIDEADRMVEKGHFAELSQLLELLHDKEYHPKRRFFVFSATLTMVHQVPARMLGKKHIKHMNTETKLEALMQKIGIEGKPKVIDLSRKEGTVETLTETRIHCEVEEKDICLYYFLLQYPGRTMVFANSIDCIKRLNTMLTILECCPLPLHANMHQKQRLKNLERFAARESCVLLTTDVAARGLDIPNVEHVIHYQMPRTTEIYVHRSGRTARVTKAGLALMLVGPGDMVHFKKICKALGKDENIPLFPVQAKCMSAIKARVNIARSIEKMEFQHNKAQQHNSWFQRAAEALELDLDDNVLMGEKYTDTEESQRQRTMKGLKKELKRLLLQPVFKNYMKTKYPTQFGGLALPTLPLASQETALTTIQKHQYKQKHRLFEQIS